MRPPGCLAAILAATQRRNCIAEQRPLAVEVVAGESQLDSSRRGLVAGASGEMEGGYEYQPARAKHARLRDIACARRTGVTRLLRDDPVHHALRVFAREHRLRGARTGQCCENLARRSLGPAEPRGPAGLIGPTVPGVSLPAQAQTATIPAIGPSDFMQSCFGTG